MSIVGEITSTNLQAIKNWIEKNNPIDHARAASFVAKIDSVDFDIDDLNIGTDTISYTDKETGYNYNFTIVDGEIKSSTGEIIGKVDKPKTEATSSRDYSSMSSAQIQAQIDAMTKQKDANTQSLEKLEKQIAQLEKQIKDATDAALDAKNELDTTQKELAKHAVANALSAYTAGDIKTPEEFQAAVKKELTNGGMFSAEQSQIVTNLLLADQNMALLDNSLGKMRSLIGANDLIDVELSALNGALTSALAREAAAAAARSCDPIAFEMGDLTYTFMIDRDGNGELTDASEFLGSSDYWSAMQALDLDGDKKVSAYEMEQGGVKLVKTGADAEQSVANVSEIFNSDGDYVDLSSYTSGGSFEGLKEGQTLLGTFNVVLDGQDDEKAGEFGGYSTFDTEDYLNDNYEFSAGAAMASTVATSFQYEEDTQSTQGEFKKFWNEHMELMAELDANLKQAYIVTGLSTDTNAETMEKVRNISKSFAAQGVESEQMVVEEVPDEEEEIKIEDLKDENGKVSFEKLEVGDTLSDDYDKELESMKAQVQPDENEKQTVYTDGRYEITVDENGKIVKKEDKLER